MKCNKCCAKIPANEEIQESKKFYCETCWKSDSWKRTGSEIVLSVLVILLASFMLIVIYLLLKNNKPEKCNKAHVEE